MTFEVSPLQREAARLVAEIDQERGREPSRRIRAIANAKPARRGWAKPSPGRNQAQPGGATQD